MSNLVGYGSSSDEGDDAQQNVAQQRTSTPIPQKGKLPDTSQTSEAVIEQPESRKTNVMTPMIGPSAPTNGLYIADAEYESNLDEEQPMSGRDAIRHLTQTTNPMTSMPPSPPGSPDPGANARFRRFLELKTKGIHFNQDLAGKSTFKNPSLMSTILSRAGIDDDVQYNTSLPQELWDPTGFPGTGYKEELLKSQQAIRDKDEVNKKKLSAAGKRTIDFTSAGRSGNSSRDSTPGLHNKRRKP